ncbi:MAG TPA: competence/damage-inducible protein A, partial [Solimonas sp.]|nr:competence/damage-inducible protein A [Solimonas sp.]
VELSLRALGTTAEGDLLPLMRELLATFPGVSLSSLPSRGDEQRGRHIEFGVKGPRSDAASALAWLRHRLAQVPGVEVQDIS